jgi:hypothetical protein
MSFFHHTVMPNHIPVGSRQGLLIRTLVQVKENQKSDSRMNRSALFSNPPQI